MACKSRRERMNQSWHSAHLRHRHLPDKKQPFLQHSACYSVSWATRTHLPLTGHVHQVQARDKRQPPVASCVQGTFDIFHSALAEHLWELNRLSRLCRCSRLRAEGCACLWFGTLATKHTSRRQSGRVVKCLGLCLPVQRPRPPTSKHAPHMSTPRPAHVNTLCT